MIRKLKRSIIAISLLVIVTCIISYIVSNYSGNSLQQVRSQLPTNATNFSTINQYFLKAFYDTRDSLGGGRKFVRIIAVLDKNSYTGLFICQFFDTNGSITYAYAASQSKIGAGMGHRQYYYQEFIISCQVKGQLTSAAYVVVLSTKRDYRSQIISVQHNPLSRSLSDQEKFGNFIINCVSVTYGNPDELRLLEWLEGQKLLGMSKVQLHFRRVTNQKFAKLAKWYSDDFLEISNIDCPFCENGAEHLQLLLMSPAINQCFYENLGNYNYTAVFDLDELIVPQKHGNYREMMDHLIDKYHAVSIAFPNWYHFYELGTSIKLPNYLPMLKHPRRTKEPSEIGYSAKSIHLSNYAIAVHNHFCWENTPQLPRNYYNFQYCTVNEGVNQHYKFCHLEQKVCAKLTNTANGVSVNMRLNNLIGNELQQVVQQKWRQFSNGALRKSDGKNQ